MEERVPRRFSIRRALAIAGLLFLAFATYRVFGVYTVRTGSCGLELDPLVAVAEPPVTPLVPDSPLLTVMSWNIEGHAAFVHDEHIHEIARVIRETKPDIVGLQEVHRDTWQSRFRDQAKELAELTGMRVYFGRSFESWGGEYGNAVLTRGRIVRGEVHPLPSFGEPRSLLDAELEIDGRRLQFFVTHLTAWGAINRSARREQLACIAAHLRRSELPYILVGDLNATPEDPEIGELRTAGVARDLNDPTGVPTHKVTEQKLDYVLADHGWAVSSVRVVEVEPSDHRPVIAAVAREGNI